MPTTQANPYLDGNFAPQTHEFGSSRYGGEAVFAPHPDGKDEDDGWLITFVRDRHLGTSELVISDFKLFWDQK